MRKPTICICENKDADQLRGLCQTCSETIVGFPTRRLKCVGSAVGDWVTSRQNYFTVAFSDARI